MHPHVLGPGRSCVERPNRGIEGLPHVRLDVLRQAFEVLSNRLFEENEPEDVLQLFARVGKVHRCLVIGQSFELGLLLVGEAQPNELPLKRHVLKLALGDEIGELAAAFVETCGDDEEPAPVAGEGIEEAEGIAALGNEVRSTQGSQIGRLLLDAFGRAGPIGTTSSIGEAPGLQSATPKVASPN